MIVKECKPKYRKIELIIEYYNPNVRYTFARLFDFDEIVRKFGKNNVGWMRNHNGKKYTTICLWHVGGKDIPLWA